jgi:phosphoribosylformylglycinamidine synthase
MGAEPLAITDCLNFGNPERPEIYYQMKKCIEGMAKACESLGVPVISGNVSLYNESENSAIYPTPVVGAVGLLANADRRVTPDFKQSGDSVFLIGAKEVNGHEQALAGSEYLAQIHERIIGRPTIDLANEVRVQKFLTSSCEQGLVHSAHDCSDGGLAIAIAECTILGNLGFTGIFSFEGRWDAALFGEDQSRIVISVPQDKVESVHNLARRFKVPLLHIGITGGNRFSLPYLLDEQISDLASSYFNGLQEFMDG